ncbi:hypothetical protein Zmor_013194 [Zophobas morio]|uniref:Uncharacterized protein n=1 Tax=Zophobas morio TaxID=2755281 RepID=A0AA38MFA6_9CUCU|nr:hypothetical protein Zmor_013194 [Zophobas morio]
MSHKYIFVLSVLLSSALSYDGSKDAKILDYQLEHTPSGHYFFRFESSDGTVREEEGNVLDENVENSPVIVKGSYSYTDETGKVYTVRYIADENGFHPEGDHIKVPPYVVNPNPVNVVLQSTPRPAAPIQFIQPTSRPQYIASEPTRFQVGSFSTTTRPEVSTTPTRIHIPVESTVSTNVATSKPIAFNELDKKLQSSIVSLLSNGDGRGFNIGAVNSI